MCDCINIEIGSYKNQIELDKPKWASKNICVDRCLKDEILFLWSEGIITTGCCCGHNTMKPMINVAKTHHKKMLDLKYEFLVNKFNTICYTPKSITKI